MAYPYIWGRGIGTMLRIIVHFAHKIYYTGASNERRWWRARGVFDFLMERIALDIDLGTKLEE